MYLCRLLYCTCRFKELPYFLYPPNILFISRHNMLWADDNSRTFQNSLTLTFRWLWPLGDLNMETLWLKKLYKRTLNLQNWQSSTDIRVFSCQIWFVVASFVHFCFSSISLYWSCTLVLHGPWMKLKTYLTLCD